MQPRVIQRILGLLLLVFSFTLLPPAGVGLIYGDVAIRPFIEAFLITAATGFALWWPVRRERRDLRLRDGFLVAVSFWLVLGLFGAIPLALASAPHLSITDAVFESMSGLTTTGATVIVGLDELPKSILFYRQELQWLGGMGIIVLAVAVLPMLGVGGMQLYRAETPGPIKDAKLTPRIAETAKALWYIYLGLTVSCAVAYWLAGMDVFDAIAQSFSTVSIGGFSTHDASLGYFRSPEIEGVAIVFMLLAGANFGLHFVALRRMSLRPYWQDAEFRTYFGILAALAAITIGYLYIMGHYTHFGTDFRQGLFQAVSIGTTTGFTTAAYHHWPGFLPALLIFASFIGGCAGSAGGGIKVVRFLLLFKQGVRELMRLVHPSGQFAVKIGRRPVDDRVIDAVWGFFAAYVATFSVFMLLLMATGLDQVTAFSAVAACMNNLGPGLGAVGDNYAQLNPYAKWVLSMAMLFGRLEIFTPLVLFTPGFWRR
ncbi:potassium transporter [Acidihalobacter yilgarnensis]|uniref:Trk system potassium uptake protein n=1 Tax=Acidihalobacter yilgarnensis TaxID=2819280 RepID=A0A1D8IJR9_9GAMM|nr:TrkH family potassium uptake protein [Acidihalobacter yilgarnensis]AOU96729.1 potassium transporter [Acidihalobacter yilgarnensis]